MLVLSRCDDKRRERWGDCRALLMGTQCAERQAAAPSSRHRCHHTERDKVGGWKTEKKRGWVGYYSPILFTSYQWQAHRHTRTKGILGWLTLTTHTHTHKVTKKWSRHTFAPTYVHSIVKWIYWITSLYSIHLGALSSCSCLTISRQRYKTQIIKPLFSETVGFSQ